jgi:hypothetical protein
MLSPGFNQRTPVLELQQLLRKQDQFYKDLIKRPALQTHPVAGRILKSP